MEYMPPTAPVETVVTFPVDRIPQTINQLRQGFSDLPIIVCIRNIWDITDFRVHNTQISTGFLCYDKQGQLLEGRFCRGIKPDDPDYLAKGDVYELSGFSVIHNSRQKKLTHLPYYIRIDQATKMLKIPYMGPIFPVPNFSPQNYESLRRLAITPNYLPDVVGQILLIQNTSPYHLRGNTGVTIGLLLHRTTVVKLILCDKQAADFSILQRGEDRKFRVVIFTSIIPKLCKGKLQLISSPATNFYFNKSIEYIKHFRGRVRNQIKDEVN